MFYLKVFTFSETCFLHMECTGSIGQNAKRNGFFLFFFFKAVDSLTLCGFQELVSGK